MFPLDLEHRTIGIIDDVLFSFSQRFRTRIPNPQADFEFLSAACEIKGRDYRTSDDLSGGREDTDKWIKYIVELLRRIFSDDQYARAFVHAGPSFRGGVIGDESSLSQRIDRFIKDLNYKIKEFESILERLDLIPEQETDLQPKKPQEMERPAAQKRKVFVVHGHDEEAKLSVDRLLEKLELSPNHGKQHDRKPVPIEHIHRLAILKLLAQKLF